MPNQTSLEQIELAELTQTVDDGRVAGDPFKLAATSRTLLDTRLADLKAKDVATLTSEGGSRHRVGQCPSGSRTTPDVAA